MRTANDILKLKGSSVFSVDPGDTVLHALGVMAEHDVGAVLVKDGERIVGILTERDYARKVVLAGRSSKDSAIRDVMTAHVICVAPDRPVEDCMALMTAKRVRHLPVIDHKTLIGLISIGDVVKAAIAEREFTIEQLQNYIAGC
jgi:CBS domain-containing protein